MTTQSKGLSMSASKLLVLTSELFCLTVQTCRIKFNKKKKERRKKRKKETTGQNGVTFAKPRHPAKTY